MEDLVVQRVRPAGRTILVDGHRRVVREVGVVQHFEHFVTTDRQEGSSHSSDIFEFDSSVSCEDLSLTGYFTGPLLLGELFAETVTVWCMESGNIFCWGYNIEF